MAPCAVSAAVLLSACTSTPLPPWTSTPTAVPGTVTTAPKSQGPAPVHIPGVSNPGVISTPVESTPLQATPLSVWQESPEVAARFPDPATPYSTPGLTTGRTTFTSNAELSQMLRQIADLCRDIAGTQRQLGLTRL